MKANAFSAQGRILSCFHSTKLISCSLRGKLTSLKHIHPMIACCNSQVTASAEEGKNCYTPYPHWKWRPWNSNLSTVNWLWHNDVYRKTSQMTIAHLLSRAFWLSTWRKLSDIRWAQSSLNRKPQKTPSWLSYLQIRHWISLASCKTSPPHSSAYAKTKDAHSPFLHPPRAFVVDLQLPLSHRARKTSPYESHSE